jgi:hypothetical protein
MAAAIANTVSVPVFYQPLVDQQVMANISFGTPAQNTIPTVIDTGSYGYWVYGPDAIVNSGSPYLGVLGPCNQTAEPAFDWEASSTHAGPWNNGTTFAYGGAGKLLTCPTVVADTLSFPAEHGYPAVPGVEVALCEFLLIKDRSTTCDGAHYDKSILGLAPGPAPGHGSARPYFRESLAEQGLVHSSVYSVWFDDMPADINEPQHGTVLLGGVPTEKHTGDVAKMAQSKPADGGTPGLYYVAMPEVRAGPIDGSGEAQVIPAIPYNGAIPECLVDTGTWGLTLPTNDTAFFAATGLEEDFPFITPRYPAPCADIPRDAALELVFTGDDGKTATVKVPYRNLAQHAGQKEGTCSLNLQLGDPGCTFGGTFFTRALTVFDDEDGTVSFAQVKE